ncbi:septum formation initiator family protein [Patescibacteria group bacterium]|nr:septum formation initiator family protein [Patescibacteria group bacterium]
MKIAINILLTIIIIVLSWQFFNLYQQHSHLKESSDKLNSETTSLEKENQDIESDIEYFSNPENLEKELKSKTSYKKPGEKTIIIIPTE